MRSEVNERLLLTLHAEVDCDAVIAYAALDIPHQMSQQTSLEIPSDVSLGLGQFV